MQVTIIENIEETDTDRGYHNRVGTVTFEYGDKHRWYAKEKEVAIIETLCGKTYQMWWKCTMREDSTRQRSVYSVHYGYDSGD